jgi:acetyl esterase
MTENGLELDERMTNECRSYVTTLLQQAKPSFILEMDLNVARKIRDDQALKMNEFFDFTELKIDEFHVKNETDNYQVLLRKYEPIRSDQSSRATVFFHGGGYTLGSVNTHHHTVGSLALRTNSTWFSVAYRKCPEFRYPVPYLDCKSALEWIIKNKKEFNFASDVKIGVCGDSSGGQIAAILAHELKHVIDYQILIYPVVHYGGKFDSYKEFVNDCYLIVPPVMEYFVKNMAECDPIVHARHLSPLYYQDFKNLPKCLIVAVELDPVLDDSKFYCEKLKESNIPCKLGIIKGTVHGYFSQPLQFKDAHKQTADLIVDFLEKV